MGDFGISRTSANKMKIFTQGWNYFTLWIITTGKRRFKVTNSPFLRKVDIKLGPAISSPPNF